MIETIKYNRLTSEVAEHLKFIKSSINGGNDVSLLELQDALEREGYSTLDLLQTAILLNLGKEEYKIFKKRIELVIECRSVVDRMIFFELGEIQEKGIEYA